MTMGEVKAGSGYGHGAETSNATMPLGVALLHDGIDKLARDASDARACVGLYREAARAWTDDLRKLGMSEGGNPTAFVERLVRERDEARRERDEARSHERAYRADLDAERKGNAAHREEFGAKPGETFREFLARLAKERDEAKRKAEILRADFEQVRRIAREEVVARRGWEEAAKRADKERAEAVALADEARANYEGACKTVAQMHAAAVGRVTGPARGVVEDVADLRARLAQVEAQRDRLDADLSTERARTRDALVIPLSFEIDDAARAFLDGLADILKGEAAPSAPAPFREPVSQAACLARFGCHGCPANGTIQGDPCYTPPVRREQVEAPASPDLPCGGCSADACAPGCEG